MWTFRGPGIDSGLAGFRAQTWNGFVPQLEGGRRGSSEQALCTGLRLHVVHLILAEKYEMQYAPICTVILCATGFRISYTHMVIQSQGRKESQICSFNDFNWKEYLLFSYYLTCNLAFLLLSMILLQDYHLSKSTKSFKLLFQLLMYL